jgi:CHASE3 domain sensor protein
VPAEEYDELSKLCDKLLTQQEQLQEEVRKQKQMLQVRVLWLQTCVTS